MYLDVSEAKKMFPVSRISEVIIYNHLSNRFNCHLCNDNIEVADYSTRIKIEGITHAIFICKKCIDAWRVKNA